MRAMKPFPSSSGVAERSESEARRLPLRLTRRRSAAMIQTRVPGRARERTICTASGGGTVAVPRLSLPSGPIEPTIERIVRCTGSSTSAKANPRRGPISARGRRSSRLKPLAVCFQKPWMRGAGSALANPVASVGTRKAVTGPGAVAETT